MIHTCICEKPGYCDYFKREQCARAWEICKGECSISKNPLPPYPTRMALIKSWLGQPVEEPPPKTIPIPCTHLGGYTGERVLCPTCAGKVEVKVMECSVYTKCTTYKQADGIACCVGCKDYRKKEG